MLVSLFVTALWTALFAIELSRDGFGILDAALILCSAVLVSWVTFWCGLGIIGSRRISRTDGAGPSRKTPVGLSSRTALLVPIHNENAEHVFANVRAMLDSLSATGQQQAFDLFVLSDSADPDLWLREESCWAALREERTERPYVYYRRRTRKFRWKSGNIADFCERWGSRYEFMIVLDADSIMDGSTIVELVRRMEDAPRVGILQAPSFPARGRTLYARLQQFSASLYGPSIFAGLDACFRDAGNYWGHNAVIRTRAFIDHCGLPGLSGRPPLGGPILSHDFVEAALMRRAGYEVRLAWDLRSGSYEQCPDSLAEAFHRDRRWCRGNLQHLRLLPCPGFAPQSRLHFGIGVLFYGISLFWAVYVLGFAMEAFLRRLDGGPARPGTVVMTLVLVGSTVLLLLLGKLSALMRALRDGNRRAELGGTRALVLGVFLETTITGLVAPITMASHVACIVRTVLGITTDWAPSGGVDGLRDAVRAHFGHTVTGALLAAFAFQCGDATAVWLSPVWFPLLLSIPIGALTASPMLGRALCRSNVFSTPFEIRVPEVLARAEELSAETSADGPATFADRFRRVVNDAWFNTLHVELLRAAGSRFPGPHRVREAIRRLAQSDHPDPEDALVVLSDPFAMRTLHAASYPTPADDEDGPPVRLPFASRGDDN